MTEQCKYWDFEIKTCRRSEAPRIAIPLDVNLDEAIRNEEFKVVRAIDLPEPKIENRWIPVTERLPEKDGRYLCSYENEFGTCVDFGKFEKNDWWVGRVTAWMPLPEPWKGDEE